MTDRTAEAPRREWSCIVVSDSASDLCGKEQRRSRFPVPPQGKGCRAKNVEHIVDRSREVGKFRIDRDVHAFARSAASGPQVSRKKHFRE